MFKSKSKVNLRTATEFEFIVFASNERKIKPVEQPASESRFAAIVVFGDTDLNRSRDTANFAAQYETKKFIVLGTEREQEAMTATIATVLSTRYKPEAEIIKTKPSLNTAGNIASLKDSTSELFPVSKRYDTLMSGPKLLFVTREPHAKRLRDNFVGQFFDDMWVEYATIAEPSFRRRLEHRLLGHLDRFTRGKMSVKIDKARESFKGAVEK